MARVYLGTGFDPFRTLDGLATAAFGASAAIGQGLDYDLVSRGEDSYELVLAAAGIASDGIEVTATGRELVVTAKAPEQPEGLQHLHRGLAVGGFVRRFTLAPHVIAGEVTLEDGLLRIALRREVPEALKPRTIPVNRKVQAIAQAA